MTNLQRLTGKIFGETATATGDDPQIGQFGSALVGTYVGTTDVATIQSLSAWSNGFIDSVTPNEQFPPLPEMTGFGKVLSYQSAYLLQKGVAEWDSGTTYYTGDFCKGVGEGKLYVSKVDSNLNNDLSDTDYWDEFTNDKADIDLANVNDNGTSRGTGWAFPSNVRETFVVGASGASYIAPSDGWFYASGTTTSTNGRLNIQTVMRFSSSIPISGQKVDVFLPVKKNGVAILTWNNVTTIDLTFIYAEGTKWEHTP